MHCNGSQIDQGEVLDNYYHVTSTLIKGYIIIVSICTLFICQNIRL